MSKQISSKDITKPKGFTVSAHKMCQHCSARATCSDCLYYKDFLRKQGNSKKTV